MKTIIIVSDTHGNLSAIEKLNQIFDESDYIVHLGDCNRDMKEVFNKYPQKTYMVCGNCDFFSGLADEQILEIEGLKLLLCHGHKYSVKSELNTLAETAKTKGCNVALYGHTHIANDCEIEGIRLINPGTLSMYQGEQSYCYLVVNKEKAVATIVKI